MVIEREKEKEIDEWEGGALPELGREMQGEGEDDSRGRVREIEKSRDFSDWTTRSIVYWELFFFKKKMLRVKYPF